MMMRCWRATGDNLLRARRLVGIVRQSEFKLLHLKLEDDH